jgi:predicted alpha-1,2-mannosidase
MRIVGTLLVAVGLAVGACSSSPEPPSKISAVDPFVGTGGAGFRVGSVNPGPTVPWGMAKPGPDTSSGGGDTMPFYHCAGYYAEDTIMFGFSHTHLHGVGAVDGGNLLLMPTLGMSAQKTTAIGYQSSFSKTTEEAAVGYYAVTLDDTGIRAELTATTYTGVHRYAFPAGAADPVVLVDAARVLGGELTSGHVDVDPAANEVTGSIVSAAGFSGRYGGLPIHFVARFATPFTTHGVWNEGAITEGGTTMDGLTLGAWVGFADPAGPVEVQVAISYIDLAQARANLAADLSPSFDETRAAAETAWEEALSVVDVEAPTEEERALFYSALYHVMQMPTLFTEAGGRYMGFDRQPHQADGFRYHSDFSLWDTYRTFHPLVTLVMPDKERDFVISLVKMYEQGGAFPRWPEGLGDSGSMCGSPADIVIADSYLKGITSGYSIEGAYAGMRAAATGPLDPNPGYGDRPGIEDYVSLGYLAADRHGGSVSVTQEYTYADFALSQLAAALGKTDDAALLGQQSLNHRNLWNPETRFFQGRNADGTFVADFDPLIWEDSYVEGDAWHYRFFPPHDLAGFIELLGGVDAFLAELETFFAEAKRGNPAIPNPYYWHSNEPCIHAPYLFAMAGAPAKTQEWVRWAMTTSYALAPDGLPGNDDAGTMSAWYVLSAMGLYPVAGKDLYVIGSPTMRRSTFTVAGGVFEIRAPDTSATNLYVQSATLGGAPLDAPFLRHADLAPGGVLELTMGPTPSEWGQGALAD